MRKFINWIVLKCLSWALHSTLCQLIPAVENERKKLATERQKLRKEYEILINKDNYLLVISRAKILKCKNADEAKKRVMDALDSVITKRKGKVHLKEQV